LKLTPTLSVSSASFTSEVGFINSKKLRWTKVG